ncbi:MAG: DNA polymerase III subunit delta' [Flavobacteriales bacterium]|nr:DNA polymerase III subunit delta' [Flavobacteriales bacterium]
MQFSKIVGQKKVKESLIQTIKENRVSHAQLYIEQPGSGALPLAIAYAQYLCCENRTDIDSCGVCPSCLKYSKLEHPDLHCFYPVNTNSRNPKPPVFSKDFAVEWRAFVANNPYSSLFDWLKSLDIENKQGNISAKESQEIINSLTLKSFESPYKVCIIWMVEKLHPSAANKLLKVLEEPPEKTLFILITQDYEFLLPTIISRTQMVQLEKLSNDDVAAALQENYNVESALAKNYAKLTEGNFAYALEMVNMGHDEEELMDNFRAWMLLCFNRNVAGMNNWVEETAGIGRVRQLNFLKYAMATFRKAIMQNFGELTIIPLLDHEKAFLLKFSKFVHEGNCIQLIQEFNMAIQHIERNVNAKIVFMDLSLKVLQLLIKKVPQGAE